jgi:NAD-dependent dihydropyrimidine dehydrogenase PreA subunit
LYNNLKRVAAEWAGQLYDLVEDHLPARHARPHRKVTDDAYVIILKNPGNCIGCGACNHIRPKKC